MPNSTREHMLRQLALTTDTGLLVNYVKYDIAYANLSVYSVTDDKCYQQIY